MQFNFLVISSFSLQSFSSSSCRIFVRIRNPIEFMMSAVQFYRHDNPSAILQFLKSHLPTAVPLYHRIQSPQNTPERHPLLLASFPPDPIIEDLNSPVTICFSDRSRHSESNTWIFSTLCLHANRPEELSQESHQLLIEHLRQLLSTIRNVGDSYTNTKTKPFNYPFSPILKVAFLHQLLTTVVLQDVGISEPTYCNHWDQLIFSTPEVKRATESLQLLEGYELATVPADQIDLVLSTSKIKRQPGTYLALPNAAVLVCSPQRTEKRLVAWAYLSIDKSLGTLYVLPEHRGKGLAKMAAAKVLRDLCDGVAGPENAQCDWCFAEVASDNAASQGVCRSLGARLHGRTTYMGIDLDRFV